MCILTSILFLGGYLFWVIDLNYIYNEIILENVFFSFDNNINIFNNHVIMYLLYSLSLAIKSCVMIFIFIWVRASFPRVRFDQLMSFCWTVMLPVIFAFIILVPSILYTFNAFPFNPL
jgi:NADH-ubiquinone oxidoreductase chain 1